LDGCPKKINIPAYMQACNMKNLNVIGKRYGRTDEKLLKDILVMEKMVKNFHELPQGTEAVCIRCGKCEKTCTQHLPIIERIEEVREIANRSGATESLRKERLQQVLCGHGYRRIAFYTAGGNTSFVLGECPKYIKLEEFDIIIADSDPQKWGLKLKGYEIKSPEEMNAWMPDCVVISIYDRQEEIYSDLTKKYPKLNIVKLYRKQDVPWVF
jgi:ferredoxin